MLDLDLDPVTGDASGTVDGDLATVIVHDIRHDVHHRHDYRAHLDAAIDDHHAAAVVHVGGTTDR